MAWSEAEIEQILDMMRAGATVQTGGSRCHSTYFYREGSWGYESFDEGYTREGPTSEAAMRERIDQEPELFRGVLVAPLRRRFTAAFLAGDREAARERLREQLELDRDPLDQGRILAAVLAWPEVEPSDELVALIRSKLSGFTAYHVFMGATGWDRSAAAAAKGIEFAEQLIAMVGEVTGTLYLRSAFHEQAGDLAAAERDMLDELERTPAGDSHRTPFTASLERLHRILRAAQPAQSTQEP